MKVVLNVDNIVSGYGKKEVLHGVSLTVREGEIVSIIGPNGSGKSTVLKTVIGQLKCRSGRVIFNGRDITGSEAHKVISLGISYTPQGSIVFPDMTVSEHLDMGAWILKGKEAVKAAAQRVYEIFPILYERRNQKAKTMSGGERQMLSLGRAMMTDPELLIMDEPSIGLAPMFVDSVYESIIRINAGGTAFLIVEQNAVKALENSRCGYVLEMGKNRFEGDAKALLENEEVRRLYLGG
ncbi:ABC transporter ATP-binding protein [Desulfobacterales bacterium HSG2]|nr:ABC transporter ATP-binding protein [Desulfobacterales bacterium HSG2]